MVQKEFSFVKPAPDPTEQFLLESFEELWKRYPLKDGKKAALRHFMASVRTGKDLVEIRKALDNYIKSDRVKKGYIKNGKTWFYNWRDWIVDPTLPSQKGGRYL